MKQIDVELQLRPDGQTHEVGIWVGSKDGGSLSAQDIIDAVVETLLLHWNYSPNTVEVKPKYDA